jgi:hypothetical protein
MTEDGARKLASPGEILGLSGSYWRSLTLHAAVKLDLFSIIGDQALSAAQVATVIGADEHGVATLLNAAAALGLLEKKDGCFSNTESSARFLVASSPSYIGFMIRHHANLVPGWARLDEAVTSGKPVRQRSSGATGAVQEEFLRGMHTQAMGIAPEMARRIDLGGRQKLLDLGGGPGTWAIHFVLHNPGLSAVVYDLEGTRPFAEETVSRFGVSDRVSFVGGDFTADELPKGFDVAWLSHILHGESPESCRSILEKTAAGLNPGGLLLVHEFILDDSGTSPLFPALFSLNMLVATEGGRSYTREELEEMMAGVGARDLQLLDFVGPTESRILAGVV